MSSKSNREFFELKSTIAVEVFLEGRKSKEFVGRLVKKKEKGTTKYLFRYDDKYFAKKNALPLGPEMPLTRREYISNKLFVPFLDRIPSRENPAYPEYCEKFGILPSENNPFILLVTIASRGPSSFVFEPVFATSYRDEDAKKFRLSLGLTVREFAVAFDISQVTITKIENKKSSGRDILKRIEIYEKFPLVALFEVGRNWGHLHESIRDKLIEKIKNMA